MSQSPFYSAPSIFAVLKNLVGKIWFEKSGSRKVVFQKKGGFILWIYLFLWFEKSGWPEKNIWFCRTTFLEPLFYTFLEKWLQNKWSDDQNRKKLFLDQILFPFPDSLSLIVAISRVFGRCGLRAISQWPDAISGSLKSR